MCIELIVLYYCTICTANTFGQFLPDALCKFGPRRLMSGFAQHCAGSRQRRQGTWTPPPLYTGSLWPGALVNMETYSDTWPEVGIIKLLLFPIVVVSSFWMLWSLDTASCFCALAPDHFFQVGVKVRIINLQAGGLCITDFDCTLQKYFEQNIRR